MPATAGRVRMPANNRVHSSAALQTHGIWQSAIGYDPYAPTAKDKDPISSSSQPDPVASAEPGSDNAYTSFQGLLALARITGSNADETRGACRKCGRVGHLTFQCRNFLSVKEDDQDDEIAAVGKANAIFDKIKKGKTEESDDEDDEDEDESESSDSDVDPEMERIIAERFKGKNGKKEERGRSKKRSSGKKETGDEEERRKEKRRRRRHQDSDSEDDEEDERRKSRKEKRRRRSHRRRKDSGDSDEGSEEEEEGKKYKRRHGHVHVHGRHRKRRDDSGSSESEERRARRKSRKGRREEK